MSSRIRRAIAVYEVLTFVATVVNVGFISVLSNVPPVLYVAAAVALVLAGASLTAGIWLWQDRPAARRLSLIVQAIQVPGIALRGIAEYGVALGLSLVFRIGAEPVGMRQPVHIVLTAGSKAEGFFLGINLLATLALILLVRWRPARSAAAELSALSA